MAEKIILWQWRVRLKPGASSPWFSQKRWKELRWRMSEDEAAKWGEKYVCDIEKIQGSGEQVSGVADYGPSAPMCSSPDKRNS